MNGDYDCEAGYDCEYEEELCYDEEGMEMECPMEEEEEAAEPKDPAGQPMLWGLLSTVNTLAPIVSLFLVDLPTGTGVGDYLGTDSNEQTAFTLSVAGAALFWLPTHLFWLVNMFTGGSASLFFMFGMIATYGGALTSAGAWIFAILAVLDDTADDAAIDNDVIPFAGLTVLNLATWFLTFTNLSVFEEWKLSQECVEWEDDMPVECTDDYGYETECPEEEYDEDF